jgi:hypothetical protein
MKGIILGSVIGNSLGILTCFWHYFRKENTLRFKWHLSFRDFLLTSRYSIVDSSVYICWGIMDYVMIGFVSSRFGNAAQVTLAVVVNLIEFSVVMDGVGMALQPLISTYFGEKNHVLIKRIMKSGVKAAVAEGVVVTVLIWIFTKQFCGLFGIRDEAALPPAITALRIVSLGFTFCSMVSLTTSYYMLVDKIAMATAFACLQNGILYILLPVLGGLAFGVNGLWAGFVASPILTLIIAFTYVYLRFGKANFPYLLKDMDSEIVVMDDTLSPESAVHLSDKVRDSLLAHQYKRTAANNAALFVEEIGLTILDRNKKAKKPLLVELSLFFEKESVLIIIRDSGILFNLTESDVQVGELSSFILSGLMEAHREKAYLITTGYNRNMIRFAQA